MFKQGLKDFIFTSESVSEGHPDKICDRISDTLVDHYLSQDPYARTAIETVATTNYVGILGETRGPASITNDVLEQLARQCIKDIGYEQDGFHWKNAEVDIKLHAQSVDIAVGVDASGSKDEGAGDQGIMFGYACNETPDLMPAPIYYSHAILKRLAEARHKSEVSFLQPDAKSQITLEYRDGQPVRAHKIVVSHQHTEGTSQDELRSYIKQNLIDLLPDGWMCDDANLYVNPTGRFVIGGPDGDAGLTGRKIIVDTYGGAAPHGGGAFSGKDPTKVDRSAAYMTRYLAKNVVAAGYAERCTIQLSYAIGVSEPLSLYVNTHGTSKVAASVIEQALAKLVDMRPRGIREHLGLNKPIYARTAAYGHFGRKPEADGGFSWEKTDLVDLLQKELG